MDTIVVRTDVEVLRVRADMRGAGPRAAFDTLESKLPSLKGRRFYGTIRVTEAGEEYYACVEREAGEDPEALELELATIPGGRYARRKVLDWMKVVEAGKMKELGADLARRYSVDAERPTIEYYRSLRELHVLIPILSDVPPLTTGIP